MHKGNRIFRTKGFNISCAWIAILIILLIFTSIEDGILSLAAGTVFVFLAFTVIVFVCEYGRELIYVLLNFSEFKEQRAAEYALERQRQQWREHHPKGAARTAMRLARGDHYHLTEDGEIVFDGRAEKPKRKHGESR